ncbi:MAG: lysophospholipid acyltransferase family protein [Deltaproteobacteria bacterium]|nr:lysophospholipid acyltransferase family protein [Deltaproteobacteria bacterium]
MSRSLSPIVYRLSRWLLRQTIGRVFTLQVEGLEHLPARGPVIICPKHQRWEDIPVIGMALPPLPHYIAKVELFRQPVVREFIGALGGVPVDRQNPRATLSSFRRLLPLLTEGAFIVVFPEGTYVTGRVGPGKHRLIQLLLKLQGQEGLGFLPFVPVGVAYEPRAWGYIAHVKLGPPLVAPGPRQAQALTNALMESIARLSGF